MSKQTSKTQANLAANTLNNPKSSGIQKKLAGSVLSQSNTNKVTSSEMATTASEVLSSNKYSETTKSLAGSVLSQAKK